MKLLSHVQLFATPWTVAYQVLLSMEFSRQEYWSGLPFPLQFLLKSIIISNLKYRDMLQIQTVIDLYTDLGIHLYPPVLLFTH